APASAPAADAPAAGRPVAAGLDTGAAAKAAAGRLHGCSRLLIAGSGADRTSARELMLKIEEACHLPTSMRNLETLLHGHLPATDETTGAVLVLCDRRAGEKRTARARIALQACARIGIACAAIMTDPGLADLAPAGVLSVPEAD